MINNFFVQFPFQRILHFIWANLYPHYLFILCIKLFLALRSFLESGDLWSYLCHIEFGEHVPCVNVGVGNEFIHFCVFASENYNFMWLSKIQGTSEFPVLVNLLMKEIHLKLNSYKRYIMTSYVLYNKNWSTVHENQKHLYHNKKCLRNINAFPGIKLQWSIKMVVKQIRF